jgi:hypothetical protein
VTLLRPRSRRRSSMWRVHVVTQRRLHAFPELELLIGRWMFT